MRSVLSRLAFWRKAPPLPTVEQQFVSAAEAWFAREQATLRLWQPRLDRLETRLRPVVTISLMSVVPHSIVTLYLTPSGAGHEVRASFEFGKVPPDSSDDLVSPWPLTLEWWNVLTRRLCTP